MGMALNLFKKQAFKKAIKLTHIELKKYFMVMYPLITMFCIRGRSQTTLTTDKTGQVGGTGNVNGIYEKTQYNDLFISPKRKNATFLIA